MNHNQSVKLFNSPFFLITNFFLCFLLLIASTQLVSADQNQSNQQNLIIAQALEQPINTELTSNPSLSTSTNSKTIFFPLKVNADTRPDNIIRVVDSSLLDALTQQGYTFTERRHAEKAINYHGAWPPPLSTLADLIPPETDYIVLGSYTKSGSTFSIDMIVYDLLDLAQAKYYFEEGIDSDDLVRTFTKLTREILSFTNRFTQVSNVAIVGNKKIDTGAILQKVKFTNGDNYQADKVRQAIKDIYKMGYFKNIEVKVNETEQGKDVIFEVVEKSVISQINISGESEIEAESIREIIELVPNNVISNRDVQDSIENIKQLYKEEGYYDTKVTADIEEDSIGKIKVSFNIKEGQKIYIKDISITGNKAFKAKKLKKVLMTSEKSWLSWITDSGVLNQDIVEQDAARLAAYYHNQGFIDAKVSSPEIVQKEDWLYINFSVQEGKRYRVGTVDVAGELIEDKTTLLELAKLREEVYFSRKVLREDVIRLTDLYAEKGYAFADARPITSKDLQSNRVNILIELDPKELVYINRIVIKGNDRTRDKVIRREMSIKETGIFNATALKQSHNRLKGLGYFENVEITPTPTDDDALMDIVVDVEEKPTGNFSIGGGYSTYESFMFMAEISQDNFLGKGQHMSIKANLSGNSNQYNISFTEPHLADSKLLFGFTFYDWEREWDDYDKDSQGFGFNLGYPIFKRWRWFGGYNFEDTTLMIEDPATASTELVDSMDYKVTSSVYTGLKRDTRNNRMDPSKGSLNQVSVKYAGGPFGGDSQFTKIEGKTSWYHSMPYETVLHNQFALGFAFDNEDDKLPIYEKFYLGGMGNIRGFKSGTISPKAKNGDKIGGGKMWYYNLEVIYPLVKEAGLKGLVFVDAGNVYNENGDWDLSEIKKAAGIGFKWASPMGPLTLVWGFNLDPKGDELSDNWDFSFGGSF